MKTPVHLAELTVIGILALRSALAADYDLQLIGQHPSPDLSVLAVSGPHAFVARNGDLGTFDITDPSGPRELGWYRTRGVLAGAADVSGRLAIVATQLEWVQGLSELDVLDLSDPSQPALLGRIEISAPTRKIILSGHHAYAFTSMGLEIIDISAPENPQRIGSYSLNTGGRAMRSAAIANGHAYAPVDDDGLHVVDVRDPTNPRLVAKSSRAGAVIGVAVSGDHAYVLEHRGGKPLGTNAMHVLDIADPADPQVIASLPIPEPWFAIAVSGTFAYVSTCHSCDYAGSAGLMVIDIATPSQPRLAGAYQPKGPFWNLVAAGRYLYAGGFSIFERRPANPVRVAHTGAISGYKVTVSGDHAYVLGYPELQIVDIRDSSDPQRKGTFLAGGAYDGDVAVSGNYAYVTAPGAHDPANNSRANLFLVLDVSDPNHPLEVGRLPGVPDRPVMLSGNYAYIAGVVVDVSNPSSPRRVGELFLPNDPSGEGGSAFQALSGNYAYFSFGIRIENEAFYGMKVVDFSDPSNLEVVGVYQEVTTYNNGAGLTDLVVSGDHVYASYVVGHQRSDGGLEVIDIRDPANPHRVGRYRAGWRPHAMALRANYVYMASGSSGVHVIDVTDPRHPRRVGGNSAYPALGVAATDHAVISVHDLFYWGLHSEGLTVFKSFRPPMILGTPRLSPDGSLRLPISGEPGSTARLQRSTNLRDWEDWAILPLGDEPTEIGDPDARPTPRRFYRALESNP